MKQSLHEVLVICVIGIAVCMMWPAEIDGQDSQKIQKMTEQLDVVLILDSIYYPPSFYGDYQKRLINVVRKFPNYFAMGDDYTRVAIISYGTDRHPNYTSSVSYQLSIELNLTAGANLVRDFSMQMRSGMGSLDQAFLAAKEQLLFSRSKVMKIVIVFTDGFEYLGYYSMAWKAAKELRAKGILIFVVCIDDKYSCTNDNSVQYSIYYNIYHLAGDPSCIFTVGAAVNLTEAIFEMIIHRIKCEFQQGCRFDDSSRESCKGEYWRMLPNDNCTFSVPDLPAHWYYIPTVPTVPTETPDLQCNMSDCEETCNEWPWEDRECQDEDSGKNLTVNRGPKPTGKDRMVEHCQKKKVVDIFCPPKTTTTTTTTTSPGREATTIAQISETPPNVGNPSGTTSGAAAMEWWVILLIALFALLIVAAIVALVVVSARRRKKKADRAAIMAKKRAAMKKASSMDPPSTLSVRSPMGKVQATDHSVQVQGQAVDESVQVSLALDTTMTRAQGRSPKTTGSKSMIAAAKKSTNMAAGSLKKK